jgi:hypothetical protein
VNGRASRRLFGGRGLNKWVEFQSWAHPTVEYHAVAAHFVFSIIAAGEIETRAGSHFGEKRNVLGVRRAVAQAVR